MNLPPTKQNHTNALDAPVLLYNNRLIVMHYRNLFT